MIIGLANASQRPRQPARVVHVPRVAVEMHCVALYFACRAALILVFCVSRCSYTGFVCTSYCECCRAKIKAKSMMCAALLDTEFLSAGKVTVGENQTRLKFMCFYKTSHLILKISTRVSRNMSTFCLTNPDVCRPQIISPWPMRCLKREPACLISASFCRHISRCNVFKA